jgi:Isochorismatase family
VATSIGVESTARQAYEHGLHVTLATDAMTDLNPVTHDNTVTHIFPRLGDRYHQRHPRAPNDLPTLFRDTTQPRQPDRSPRLNHAGLSPSTAFFVAGFVFLTGAMVAAGPRPPRPHTLTDRLGRAVEVPDPETGEPVPDVAQAVNAASVILRAQERMAKLPRAGGTAADHGDHAGHDPRADP